MLTLRLPFPPPLSALFSNFRGRGRVTTKRYNAWKREASKALLQQPIERIKGPVTINVQLGRPDRRRRDLSNHIKALEDLLVAHAIIEDDSLIESLSLAWGREPGAVLRIWPYTAERAALAALPAGEEAA